MRTRSILLLLVGFGLLPFWVSLVVMFAGGVKAGLNSDYWTVGPWLALMGFRASEYTILVAIVTILVHEGVRGNAARKRHFATLTLCLGVFVSLLLMGLPYYRKAENDKHNEQQRKQVLEFARRSDIVRDAMPEPVDLSANIASRDKDGRARTFEVRIQSRTASTAYRRSIYAIVDVTKQGPPPTFSIRCFTQQNANEREAWDPCRKPLTR